MAKLGSRYIVKLLKLQKEWGILMSAKNDALAVQSIQDDSIINVRTVQQRQKSIWDLMANAMDKGTDYGTTPGCGDKPSLYKSGSEKILSLFQLAVEPQVKDLCPLGAGPYDEYRIRVFVNLQHNGVFSGKGLGECSSWEEKYKWRRAVNDAEFEYMQNINPDLVRIKFGKGYQSKPDYQIKQVRVPTADIANTVLKMGKKRAQIDATLTVTAASAIFSQDLEDMPEEIAAEIMEGQEEVKKKDRPTHAKRKEPETVEAQVIQDPDCITKEQKLKLWKVATGVAKFSADEIRIELAKYKGKDGQPLKHTEHMMKKDYDKFMSSLPNVQWKVQDEPGSNG